MPTDTTPAAASDSYPGAAGAAGTAPGTAPGASIHIHVLPGGIRATPQGGNAHVYRSRKAHALLWSGDTPFSLEFVTFDDEARREWPFLEPEPSWPVVSFTGTPKGGTTPSYYKYTVSAGGLFLDPIVIIDK